MNFSALQPAPGLDPAVRPDLSRPHHIKQAGPWIFSPGSKHSDRKDRCERNQSWTLGTSSWEESALMHLGFFVNWNLDAKKERRVNVPLGALKYIYKHWSSSVGRADLHLHSYDQSKTSLLWGVWSVQALNQSVKMPLSRTPLRAHTLASYKLSAPTVLQNTQHSRNRAKCKGLLVGQLEPNHSEEEVLRYLPEKPPTRAHPHLPQSAMQAFL